jgi:hypothetical protein
MTEKEILGREQNALSNVMHLVLGLEQIVLEILLISCCLEALAVVRSLIILTGKHIVNLVDQVF